MPQTPGHLVGDMKWLVARYPRPPGKLIVLGAVLTDPEEPESSLTRVSGSVPIDEKLKEDSTQSVRGKISSELLTNASGIVKAVLPTNPLFNAGASMEAHSHTDARTAVDAMNVKAEIFYPDDDYMKKVLEKPEIIAHIKKHTWSASLYMIVGVATAGKLTVTEDQSQDRGASASLNASGGGVEGETGFEYGTTAAMGSVLETDIACDFAYRVREFEYRRLTGNYKNKGDITEGALFGDQRKEEDDDAEEDTVPGFDGWADEDEESDELLSLKV